MTGNKEWLIDIDPSIKSNIRFAINSTIIAEGIGRVQLNCKNGKMAYMNDVLYIPLMKSNLLNPTLIPLLELIDWLSKKHKHI